MSIRNSAMRGSYLPGAIEACNRETNYSERWERLPRSTINPAENPWTGKD